MKTVIVACDRCGTTQEKAGARWEEEIAAIKLWCPKDGINGGALTPELCMVCRDTLYCMVSDWLEGGKWWKEGVAI